MQKFTQNLLFISILLLSLNVNAQILAPYANLSDTVNRDILGGPDSLFIFNYDNDSTFIIVDTQSYKGYNSIEWEEYQQGVGFVALSTTEEKLYFVTDSIAKGYRVIITKGVQVDTMNCWVVKNDFEMEITSKDFGDTLWVNSFSNCGSIELIRVNFEKARFKYFNHLNDTLYYAMTYNSEWRKEIEEAGDVSRVGGNSGKFITYRIAKPYWEGMWYTHIITDNAGLEKRDSTYVRSITPKAEFTKPEPIHLNDSDFYADRSDAYYTAYGTEYYNKVEGESAPANYPFISSDSKNAHEYYWYFGDTSKILRTTADTVIHKYNYWGDFEPYLIARHIATFINKVCDDTMRIDPNDPIKIDKPHLMAPNAFSPPGGDNPIWRFSDVSITDFEIVIFNRNGLKVHSYKGNIRDWEGWDGRYKNANNIVPTGVYFYIVKKYNYVPNIIPELTQDIEWPGTGDNNQYRGFIHVFNTEQ